jgi:hypothetical protein
MVFTTEAVLNDMAFETPWHATHAWLKGYVLQGRACICLACLRQHVWPGQTVLPVCLRG